MKCIDGLDKIDQSALASPQAEPGSPEEGRYRLGARHGHGTEDVETGLLLKGRTRVAARPQGVRPQEEE